MTSVHELELETESFTIQTQKLFVHVTVIHTLIFTVLKNTSALKDASRGTPLFFGIYLVYRPSLGFASFQRLPLSYCYCAAA